LRASFVEFPEDLVRPIKAGPAPEVTAVSIQLTAVDAAAGTRRVLALDAGVGDLGDMVVGMAVERHERELVGLRDLPERVAAAQGRFKRRTLGMPAGGAGNSHGCQRDSRRRRDLPAKGGPEVARGNSRGNEQVQNKCSTNSAI
jgi:hypothetical protein